MRVFAITGGIASGKSTACRILRQLCPGIVIFDADASARALLTDDPQVLAEVTGAFGREILRSDGKPDRERLRGLVFSDSEAKTRLEGILHPRVREECLEFLARAAKQGAPLFVADVPLLFENGFQFGQESALLVAATESTQLRRIKARNRFDDRLAKAILASQMPVAEKLRRADVVFWNEGPESVLRSQIRRFLQSLSIMTDPDLPSEAPSSQSAAEASAAVAGAPARPPVPERIFMNEFREKPLAELLALAASVPARIPATTSKSQLVFELLGFFAREGTELIGEGVLEQAKENFAMLRDPARSFRPSPDDIYINGHLLRDHDLREGQLVRVKVRAPRDRDKYLSAMEIQAVEGVPLADFRQPKDFDKLTPVFPDRRLVLEGEGPECFGVRMLDLIAPLGKGQRGIIVAPPRGGKTILLKQIARSIRRNHPESELVILLLDERPEEVTDFEETVGCPVYSSTFDESSRRHAQLADLVIERAKRLVELGKDVVLLLDSLTRLARGHNSAMQSGGPVGSGGVNPVALQKSRKFFGTARNVEEGGSLTILATALIETESRMDDVIFEEFKGTGNMEVRLDRELAERRIFPAIHIPQSGTRNDDRLYHPDEFVRVLDLRRQLAQKPVGEAVEDLLKNLRATRTNAELLLRGLR
jgi:transcription termination factor Rho